MAGSGDVDARRSRSTAGDLRRKAASSDRDRAPPAARARRADRHRTPHTPRHWRAAGARPLAARRAPRGRRASRTGRAHARPRCDAPSLRGDRSRSEARGAARPSSIVHRHAERVTSIGRTLDAVTLGVLHQRRRMVEPHRPVVQHRAVERRRMMRLRDTRTRTRSARSSRCATRESRRARTT